MKKILKYTEFKESLIINEGFLSLLKDKIIDKLSGWSKKLLIAIKNGNIKLISFGPLKGKPIAMLFIPENGTIASQLKLYKTSKIDEAYVSLKHPNDRIENETYKEISDNIKELYKKKINGHFSKPIFIFGAPGIGKSEMVASVADELGVNLLYMDLQFYNPEDMIGVPSQHNITPVDIETTEVGEGDKKRTISKIKTHGTGFTRKNLPSVLPTDNGENGKGGFIFMDELNRANRPILDAIMQLIQYPHRIENYTLPDKWIIIAAGNRKEDDPEAGIADLGSTLMQRFTVSNFEPEYEEWSVWAKKEEDIMPELVIFLKDNSDLWHYNDPDRNKDSPWPSPRAWTHASKTLISSTKSKGLKHWTQLSDEYIRKTFSKEVGPEAAGKFKDFLSVLREMNDADIENVCHEPLKAKIPNTIKNKPTYLYAISEIILGRIKKYSTDELFHLLQYVDRYKQGEILSWLYGRILDKYPKFSSTSDRNDKPGMPGYDEYLIKQAAHKLLITQAKATGVL